MSVRKKDTLGEGSFSVCFRGTDTQTGDAVAIKVYKANRDARGWARPDPVTLLKFQRQVAVLQELQRPFPEGVDPALRSDQLSHVQPADVFMRMMDFSRDANGEPGPDPHDGGLYIVTELAEYSLKDLLGAHRCAGKRLPREAAHVVAADMLRAVAGLHAKGFVHMDIKPSNLMVFNGRLKLIDTDGCVKAGTMVSKADTSISFSPCYCAPEFARFLTQRGDLPIEAAPGLDSWSTGMALCEVIHLSEILSPAFQDVRDSATQGEEGYAFMEWLGRAESVTLPRSIIEFDAELEDLLSGHMLVCEASRRATPAQCLSHRYFSRPEAWTFPTRQHLVDCAPCGAGGAGAKLVEATLRLVNKDVGKSPKRLSAVRRLVATAPMRSCKALKLAKGPALALDRSVQVLKSVLATMVAADMGRVPQLRSAFEEA